MKKSKVLFFVNHCTFLVSHRLKLINQLSKEYKINVVSGLGSDSELENQAYKSLKKNKISLKVCNFNPSSLNMLQEFLSLVHSFFYIKKVDPNIIHTVSLKGNLYGGIIALILKKPIIFAFSGFGYLFTDKDNFKKIFFRKIFLILLKVVFLNKKKTIIVQNSYDRKYLINNFGITNSDINLIHGSGTNIIRKISKISNKNVLFPARVLVHKGIREFVDAARILKKKYNDWNFLVAGSLNYQNPTKLEKNYIDIIINEGCVKFLGHVNNMKKLYRKTEIVCLPSYREGLSLALIEACANFLPVVTTNIPGNKVVVKNNFNGFKVKVKNASAIVKKIERLILNKPLRRKFGNNSAILAKNLFDINDVINKHRTIYEKISKKNNLNSIK